MFKKYFTPDYAFFALCWVFLLACVFEIVKLILTSYTFSRAIIVFVCVVVLYASYKYISLENKTKKIKLYKENKYVTLLVKYRDSIVYTTFIILCIVALLSMLFNTGVILKYALYIFAGVYIVAKLSWFNISTNLQKSSVSRMNTLRFFLILYSLYFVIIKLMCDSFGIIGFDRMIIFIVSSLLYLVSWFFIFFESSFLIQRILRPYSVAMGVLIISLVWLLWYQNGFFGSPKTIVTDETPIIEDMNLPGMVSDEVAIIEDETENIFSIVTVADAYDLEVNMTLGSEGWSVSDLQVVLWNLQYFVWEVDGVFAEDTRAALTEALIGECDWPESTRWIFGPQAKDCIDNLEISISNEEDSENIISDEVEISEGIN